MAREQQKRRRRLDFKYRNGMSAVGAFAFGKRGRKRVVINKFAAPRATDAEALVQPHQIRRGIDVHALPRGFEDGAHERHGRTLAVGAGDMDHRRQMPLGMAERRQQPFDAAEGKIDSLRMKRQEPRLQIGQRASRGRRGIHAGAGKLRLGVGAFAGAFSRTRQSRAMVERSA
jgi:hypothetical protein